MNDEVRKSLSRFVEGNLAVDCKDSIGLRVLWKMLDKYNFIVVDYGSHFRDSVNTKPYVCLDEYFMPHAEKSLDIINHRYDIHDCITITELEQKDKSELLQDFKDGKLVVQLINSYQYEKFISYLKENGIAISSKTEYTQNPSHFPYFYMLRPGVLTAGESYEAIKNYIHINKLVPLGVFMPAFEKTMKEANLPKLQDLSPEGTNKIDKEDLIAALYDRFHEENQPNNITQVNLGDIISFIKDYKPELSKENEDLDYDSKEDELEL